MIEKEESRSQVMVPFPEVKTFRQEPGSLILKKSLHFGFVKFELCFDAGA